MKPIHSVSLTVAALLLFCSTWLGAQDPFFQHFYGNESSYNPAYVGMHGASSITLKRRTQWGAENAQAFQTHQAVYEDSAPCFFADWGFVATHNVEGEGLLETTEYGFRTAFFIPTEYLGKRQRTGKITALGNLRIGFGLHYGKRQIDFSRLIFLDQLNPLYGLFDRENNLNTTDFNEPQRAESPWYFSPSIGLLYRHVMDVSSKNTWAVDVSAAVHNWGGLISKDSRQSASLLSLDNPLGERYVFGLSFRKIFADSDHKRYWALQPQAILQIQEGLRYLETGAKLSWSRNLNLGAFYHIADPTGNERPQSNWTSLQVEMGMVLPDGGTRFDLGISYAIQTGGLKNYVRAPFELTATFSFAKSVTCTAIGKESEVPYGNNKTVNCYDFNVSPSRRKLYDDIWYKKN